MLFLIREISFVRLIIPFMAGIVGAVFLPASISPVLLLSVLLVGFMIFTAFHFSSTFKFRWFTGTLTAVLFLAGGYLLTQSRIEINHPEHYSKFISENSRCIVRITEPVSEKKKSYKTIAEVEYVLEGQEKVKTFGDVLIYFKKHDAARELKYGDVLLISAKPSELPEPSNPHEFDYKEFMSFRQIYHQCYLTDNDWVLLERDAGNPLMARVLDLRQRLCNILEENIEDEKSLAVATSLIIGMREKLDDEVIQAYSASGAMHVLAVSGLHVAIMFVVFDYMLFFLNATKRTKILKSVTLIILIWLYAAVTGLSPSVLRAAVMFTFVAFGKDMKWSSNIYNVLAASAFSLLCYDPFLLMEVGFQLSYLAVLGIVVLQAPIYNLLYVRNWLLDKIWMITAVSIAAQVATFPIGLLFFHQFPVYFLISNLFVIPASTLVLYIGTALFAFSWFEPLANILGWVLSVSVYVMNWVIFKIEELPYAMIQGISFTVLDSWLVYAAISGLVAFILLRRFSFLLFALSVLSIYFIALNARLFQQMKQKKLVVYDVSKHSAIDFIYGKKNVFVADSLLVKDDSKMLFHIKHNWWESGLKQAKISGWDSFSPVDFSDAGLYKHSNFLLFHGKRIGVIQDTSFLYNQASNLNLDYIIISKNPEITIEQLMHVFSFDEIIFDASNFRTRTSGWLQECEQFQLKCYDVGRAGAYIKKF